MQKKFMKYAVLVLCACLVLSGCNLIRTNPEYIAQQEAERIAADNAIVLATFPSGTVTKGEIIGYVQDDVNTEGEFMSYSYAMMGMAGAYSMTADRMNAIKEEVVQAQAEREVLTAKLSELGLEAIDEEAVKAEAENKYNMYLLQCLANGISESDAARYLMIIEGITPSALYRNEYDTQLKARLLEATTKDVTVDEGEVKAEYNTQVDSQREEYTTSPEAAEAAANKGTILCYMPEGCKYVKHILVMPEDTSVMENVATLANEIDSLKAEIESLTENAAQATEGEADNSEELNAKEAELEAKTAEHAAAVEAAFEAMKDELDEINQKIADGADFDELIEEYSKDSGSKRDEIAEKGYLVYSMSEGWVPEFLEGVNALEEVGSVSEPVLSSYGAHIIKYVAEAAAGEVPYETVSEKLSEKVLADKKEDAYALISEGWIEEAGITYSYDNWKIR